jgi:hypothetical protein
LTCGVPSLPEARVRFVTEVECRGCYLIRCSLEKEARIAAAKVVATLSEGPGRDVLLDYLRR